MRSHCIARINHTHLLLTGGYGEAGAATATATAAAHIYDIEKERFRSDSLNLEFASKRITSKELIHLLYNKSAMALKTSVQQ